jgi:hypothetical protein
LGNLKSYLHRLFQGFEAAGANFYPPELPINLNPDTLDIGPEFVAGFPVGVAHPVPKLGPFSTQLTFGHFLILFPLGY